MNGVTSDRRKNLQRLLKPRNIAFIGGSNLDSAIRSTEAIGFTGDIWVVNPKYETIAGHRCYRDLDALPGVPDAAFVAINNQFTVDTVAKLSALGAGGAICYAAGFAEMGAAGAQLQRELVAASGDLAIVGPNCYGVLNYLDGAAMWPDRHGGKHVENGVAIISQSGNIALNLTMADRSCPVGYVISVGNQAVLGVPDYIDALLEDSRVRAIGIYLEGLTDVVSFTHSAVRALERGVPIVVLKTGTSELGTQLTMSHTASLAGADDLYQALFRRLGVIRVNSLTELIETLKLCAITGPAPGPDVAILTCSGGDSAISADLAETAGVNLPTMEPAQIEALRRQLPDFASISNPIDYNTAIWGKPAELERCFVTVMQGQRFDVSLLVLDIPKADTGSIAPWYDAMEALARAKQATGKMAVVASTIPELFPESAREELAAHGIAPLQGIGRALRALGNTAWYTRYRHSVLASGQADRLLLNPLGAPTNDDHILDEWKSKRALSRYGLTIPAARQIHAADAADAAHAVGFPVALKLVSHRLPHKTEAGAVKLNLATPADVEQATAAILHNVSHIADVGDQFLVEQMVNGAVAELIIGLKRDPQFGLALVLGSGGILVELLKDSAVLLLPTSREDVRRALSSLRIYPLLQGFRGKPPGDIEATIDAIMAVANYAHDNRDNLLEVDVNPLMVLPAGHGVVAADALIRVGSEHHADL